MVASEGGEGTRLQPGEWVGAGSAQIHSLNESRGPSRVQDHALLRRVCRLVADDNSGRDGAWTTLWWPKPVRFRRGCDQAAVMMTELAMTELALSFPRCTLRDTTQCDLVGCASGRLASASQSFLGHRHNARK